MTLKSQWNVNPEELQALEGLPLYCLWFRIICGFSGAGAQPLFTSCGLRMSACSRSIRGWRGWPCIVIQQFESSLIQNRAGAVLQTSWSMQVVLNPERAETG